MNEIETLQIQIKKLEVENERLKNKVAAYEDERKCLSETITCDADVIYRINKENAELKCLALHGMIGYAVCKMNVLAEEYEKEFASGMVHKDFSRWNRLRRLWFEAYRKAKKELMEGK